MAPRSTTPQGQRTRESAPSAPPADSVFEGDPADPIAVGRRIRYRRKRLRVTLGQLAEQVGMAASALSLIENGKREPKLSTLGASPRRWT
ncbi:helix-turn-helix transcriptional regulator [Kocuria atrinae]|uniref:helix-turn-helix domain-containing protein n=1 Tax=Kocuria atrinae TaxID=592377 RepID=UPI00030B6907|nr:helix-turn-helix transcriptional regulator [Kocuria atrinae]